MVSWYDDGAVSGYSPSFGGVHQLDRFLLASPGCVDINGITRLQYNCPQPTYPDKLTGIARLNYTPGDFSAAGSRFLTASMFVVEASLITGTPTPSAITSHPSVRVWRAANAAVSNGNTTFNIFGPRPADLSPGVKYWVVVSPTSVGSMTSVPHRVNDLPFGGSPDTLGRGVTIWTNRTPSKPVITSPASNTSVGAGTTVTLAYTSTDPDQLTGGTGKVYNDRAGVHFQYRRRPTVSDPNPTWYDLQIMNGSSVPIQGWYIDGNLTVGGAFTLWDTGSMNLRLGDIQPNMAYLPSGDWQVRCRTFDYGHPYPTDLKPLGGTTVDRTPDTYPSANTSEWSDAITVLVAAQTPPPIPLAPKDNVALADSLPVNFSWRFRSTATPPFSQLAWVIQYREVGSATWLTLNGATSPLQSYSHPPGTFFAGRNYEWRVVVSDNDSPSVASEFSEPESFWMVPAPGSGEVRPLPDATIDAATLGCGTHRAFIYKRGGTTRVGEITAITHLDWSRVRDDISTAEVRVADWGVDCGNLLASLQTWAYELVIFRDNGYSVERVWEGPITLLTYKSDEVTIKARDVMAYAYRRIIKERMSDAGEGSTVVDRARRVLQNSLADDDPNVLAYLVPLTSDDDSMQYRTTPAYSRTAFEEIDDMAANAGLDYTAVGRSILLWGTRRRIGTLPEFRDEDLGAVPIVSEYGMSMANFYAVSDGNGIAGTANRLDVSGNDPVYGRVEMLSSTWASDAPIDTGTYTQEGINTIRESFAEYAERSIEDRYPPPVVVRVPDNTSLNPSVVISIQSLVPGVVIPLRSSGTLRTVRGNQKLDSVRVVEESGSEKVSITLSPFNRDDADMSETEE